MAAVFRYFLLASGMVVLLAGGSLQADIIDFETTPDGSTPSDNAQLADPYDLAGGGTVRFFFDMNGNNRFDTDDVLPEFEAVGGDFSNGFVAEQVGDNQFDQARSGSNEGLGTRFLNKRNGLASFPGTFTIAYDTTQIVDGFSGEIWDIDGGPNGTEQWLVTAIDENGTVLQQLLSPEGTDSGLDSLDSLPWEFQFRNLPDSFRAIRFEFVGTQTFGFNMALDNFSATQAVPEPGLLGIIGLFVSGQFLKRKRNEV